MSKRIIQVAAVMLLMAFAGTSIAQVDSNSKVITKEGSSAMILSLQGLGPFGFGGPNDPFSFGIGEKYYISDGLALRGMLSFSSTSGSFENPSTATGKPSTTAYGIGIGLEKHCPQPWNVSPYWGGQIGYGHISMDDGSGASGSTTDGTIIALQIMAGFDWYVWRGIALGGEAAVGWQSLHGAQIQYKFAGTEGGTTDGQTVSTITLGTSSNIHLLVFF